MQTAARHSAHPASSPAAATRPIPLQQLADAGLYHSFTQLQDPAVVIQLAHRLLVGAKEQLLQAKPVAAAAQLAVSAFAAACEGAGAGRRSAGNTTSCAA